MRRAWTILKLVYLYLQYFLLGLLEEGFQIQKAGYLCDLGLFAAAAKAYQKALRETQSPFVQASLGYCYLCLDLPEKAVEYLGRAYERRPIPNVGATLLQALRANGDTSRARELSEKLKRSREKLSPEAREVLARYEAAEVESAGMSSD